MCGIFGFATSDGAGPDIDRLRRIALVTQTRGMHAFGLAWIDRRGGLQAFKTPGPAQKFLDELERVRGAVMVIGHCRYATHGSPQDNRNNHPHPAGAGLLVHNGVVRNDDDLVARYGLVRRGECDSETLGLLLARCPGTLAQRSVWMASQIAGDFAVLAWWRRPARLLIARRGRPLCWGQSRAGYYFASLAQGLPGRPAAVLDRSTRVLVYEPGGELVMAGAPRALGPGGLPAC
jgi:glucosamine 6-phosphate synthetase-like amidotransferase/phosphosugar isomerase protein